ncbi:arginine--tRNA ligase [bacterium]|nr:arginine--tRNA ligase [bacterium]
MKQIITQVIKEAIKSLYSLEDTNFTVDFPSNSKFGDYASNVAMVMAKVLKKNPVEVAQEIAKYLDSEATTEIKTKIAKISVVGAFINFTISQDNLWNFVQHKGISLEPVKNNKKIFVEYGQPNTHKLPHIGHIFSYIAGESFARLLSAVGHTVAKANYQGDVGPHVAKALYGYIQLGQPKPTDPLERVMLLQKCYQEGSSAYDEDPIAKKTIDDINKKIYTHDPEITTIWKETRQWSIDYYQTFEQSLGVQQTYHYFESETWERGRSIVKNNIGKVFEENEGAVIFPGEKYGLHTRVFLTKNDTPTYEAKDIGLNIQKYEDWKYDLNLITTANEQNGYFSVVIKALELCFPELVGKVQHLGFGLVSLSTGKMSSRTGKILSAIDLVSTVKERVREVMKDRENMSEVEKSKTAEIVTMGAIKFAFLKQNIFQDMKFDLEESVSFEGKSGPYIQYTYARIKSILKQVEIPEATNKDGSQLVLEAEMNLMRWLSRFPTIVLQAAEQLAPHIVAEYTHQTAQLFNTFYSQCPINAEQNKELQRARRTLAEKTAEILKSGLNLIGIEVVEKM